MNKIKYLFIVLLYFSFRSFGYFPMDSYQFVRPSGMGNAFLALSDDANVLFYNPAALTKVKGLHFNLLDVQVSVDQLSTLDRIKKALLDEQPEQVLDPNRQALGVGLKPTFIMPYFGLSLFNQGFGYFNIDSLASATVEAQAYNDLGVALAFGIPFSPYFSFGFGVRAIQRNSINLVRNTAELISELGMDSATFLTDPWKALSRYVGVGYAFPLYGSILLSLPKISKSAPHIQLSLAADHIGNTTFKQISGIGAPQQIGMSYHFGSLLQYQINKGFLLNITADYRNIFQNDLFTNKFQLGAELRNKYFGLRTGVSQGYPSFGASLEFPPQTRLHFSTFSTETGNSLWEREQRWYQVQLIIGLNPL